MPETRLGAASLTGLNTAIVDYSVDPVQLDSAMDQEETEYLNTIWTTQLGYYTTIPELRGAIDAKGVWTVGKGYEADPEIKLILDDIRGFGKDSFNTILENMIRTYYIGGDSFAEVVRDNEGNLINLKPMDPGTVKVIVNRAGLIKRYEQTVKSSAKDNVKFKPEDIFHLSRNRIGDEIHGISVITALEDIIKARKEAFQDQQILMHRNVKPVRIWHVDEDDDSEITKFIAKIDKMYVDTENIVLPKGAVEVEVSGVAPNQTLNILPWIEHLNNYFYEVVGTPKIIVGNSQDFTDASSKISYMVYLQSIEEEQLYIEEQVGQQLGIGITLSVPANIQNDLISDTQKDGPVNVQPNETATGGLNG